jgi:hypothetical protein
MSGKNHPENAGVNSAAILFCDLRCEHADFAKADDIDGSGSCRTFAAIWCKLLEEHVTKNAPCPVRFGRRRPKSSW